MHAVAAALFVALAVLASDSALARAPYGKVQGGGSGKFGKAQGGAQPSRHHGHHHHHHHGASFVGVGFGFAYPWYWHYPPPYYYPGYYHPHPVTYVEQGASANLAAGGTTANRPRAITRTQTNVPTGGCACPLSHPPIEAVRIAVRTTTLRVTKGYDFGGPRGVA